MSIISVQFIAPFHSDFSGKKTKHTDSEVTKTHVSNRHYRVNLVIAGIAYQIAVQTICLERTANQNKTALKGNELKRFVLDTGWTERLELNCELC